MVLPQEVYNLIVNEVAAADYHFRSLRACAKASRIHLASTLHPPLPRLPPSLLPHFHLDSDQNTLEGSGLYLSASGCSARPGVKR